MTPEISNAPLRERLRLIRAIQKPGSLRMKRKGEETPQGRLSIVISLAAILISMISAYYTYQQSATYKESSFPHITPRLRVDLAYPRAEVCNPEFLIMNNGPISVASIAIDYRYYLYDKKLKKVTSVANMSDFHYEQISFTKNLDPAESVRMELPGFQDRVPETLIGVFVFQMRYYRTFDLQEYNQTEMFFVDSDRIRRHESFMSSAYYGDLMRAFGSTGHALKRGDKEKSRTVIDRWEVEN